MAIVPKRPGVFVNESLTPLTTSSSDVGAASLAAFVGTNGAGGPLTPALVTSWTQFVQVYGGFGAGTDLLPFAVYEFFNNGGGSCVVVRAANSNAVTATKTLKDASNADVLGVTAISPGKWGNNVTVSVNGSGRAGAFDLIVNVGSVTERFTDVTLDPADPRNALAVVNSPYAGSAFVRLDYKGPASWLATAVPAVVSGVALATGTDGTGTPDLVAATQQLSDVTGIFDINLPGVTSNTVINPLIAWAKDAGRFFLVVDGVQGGAADTAATNAAAQVALLSGASALTQDSTAAVYGPWLLADDPASRVPGAQRLLPPGGFVLGQYARTDVVRGVQKPAAGVSASLRGVLAPQYRYAQADLDTLNTSGINAIKVVPGAGVCIFGARTLSVGMPDRYINIRRSLISIKNALIDLTRFAVFETNDSDLRATIEDLVSQYLRTQWNAGVLAGDTEEQAFTVKCDDENNPPSSIANGFINIAVGVAPQTPAEFIVFNIGQTVSGVTADEA